MKFQDQVVVVTGASRGIGLCLAKAFAGEGAKVACVATTEANAVAAATSVGASAKAFACDVSNAGQVEKLISDIETQMGVPSVLVNNAGITRDGLLLRMKEEDWDRVLSVNLKGAFLVVRAAIKSMMKNRYGRIVNVSSVVGLHGAAGQANYSAAKAGLIGFTKSVAKELGSRGITCNAVAPGFIETDMTSGLSIEFREHVSKTAPAGRLGAPEDVAPAVLFLAGRDAGYITGQCLAVDGGLML